MPRTKNPDMFAPQPYRVRNILTLEERVRAIAAYDARPMYTKIAKKFNCSWEQIKNIIMNREAIMSFYEATKNTERVIDASRDDLRQRKINFLNECIYEYIQRVQFHTKQDITEELIRMKAYEFLEIMEIDKFVPNRAWINHFKASFDFSLSNRQIKITRTPPASLDLKDIMTYCTKNQATIEKVKVDDIDRDYYDQTVKLKVNDIQQRRIRKLQFMDRALLEYIQRAQYHKKIEITETVVRELALELKEILKIDNFQPNGAWFSEFRKRFSFYFGVDRSVFKRAPPLSLDLKDILSYCSRMDPKNQLHITFAAKSNVNEDGTPKLIVRTPALVQAALRQLHSRNTEIKAETMEVEYVEVEPQLTLKEADVDQLEDVKPDVNDLNAKIDLESNSNSDKRRSSSPINHMPLKIQKVEVAEPTSSSPIWQEPPAENNNGSNTSVAETLPLSVTNAKDALKLLKPLEEFALMEQNYRAIGLISQLEEIFKRPPETEEILS